MPTSESRLGRGRLTYLLLGLMGVFALLITACGADPTPTPQPTATPTAAPAATPTAAPPAWKVEWDKTIAAAQEEGELVTFLCCAFGRAVTPFMKEFEDKFGIKWTNSTGSSRQQWEKVKAERKAGVYTLDVWTGGLRTSNSRLLPGGALADLRSQLFHPEVLDESLWFQGEHFWGDNAGDSKYVFAYGGSASLAEITYNTDLVDPAEIQSYQDLVDPKWKGKIIARDPRISGTSQSTATFYQLMGKEWLRKLLTEMDMVIVEDARQAAEQLAMGKYSLCLFACGTEVKNAKDDGLPVQDAFPHALEEGSRISTGGNTLMAMKDAPHPNAQKLFLNWFLSKEGQLFWQRVTADQSLRDDLPTDMVEPLDVRNKDKKYILLERDPDFQKTMEDAVQYAIDVLK